MAVLAQYTPPSDSQYGRSANLAFSGINEGLSIMERKQAMELNQQRADQQRAEFMAKLPLINAQTTLTQVNAAAAVKNATDITNAETKAAAESVMANREFMDAQQLTIGGEHVDQDGDPTGRTDVDTQATWEARANKLAQLRAKYAYMANLKDGGYGAFYDTLTKSWVQANENAHINLKADEALAVANIRADAARTGAATKLEGTKYTADSKTANAGIYTQSRERIAQINNDAKLTIQEKGARIAAERSGATIANLTQRAVESDQAAAEASASGDEAAAAMHRQVSQQYRDAARKQTTFSGQEPGTPAAKSPPLAKTPTEAVATSAEQAAAAELVPGAKVTPNAPILSPAPGSRPPKETTINKDGKTYSAVEVDGKTYPIVVDKNGKRAYVVDGHAVLLNTP